MSSNMNRLLPNEALGSAVAVYGLKKGYSIEDSFLGREVDNLFDFSESRNSFSAQSGVFEFKQNAGFAIIAKG